MGGWKGSQVSAELSANTTNGHGWIWTAVDDALNQCRLQRTVLAHCGNNLRGN